MGEGNTLAEDEVSFKAALGEEGFAVGLEVRELVSVFGGHGCLHEA